MNQKDISICSAKEFWQDACLTFFYFSDQDVLTLSNAEEGSGDEFDWD